MEQQEQTKRAYYQAPDIDVISVDVEGGYSFSDPIKDEEQGWD